MNYFTCLGFPVQSEGDLELLAQKALALGDKLELPQVTYVRFQDLSGVQLWLLFDKRKNLLDMNPHYAGQSKRLVCLTETVPRQGSDMDGAFYCWAEPARVDDPESGLYPYVFDVPDFHTMGKISFPRNWFVQLTAFAHDMRCHDDEREFADSQFDVVKFTPGSFVPTGLYSQAGLKTDSREAFGTFAGSVKDCASKTNGLSNLPFWWILVETLGGDVDVVVALDLLNKPPRKGGIVYGDFWLSGRLIDPPPPEKRKGFFDKLFGR
ncbi:MAG TPA: hypothetical protein V6D17_13110 [Candidatus Obscuribacterales bacterium]